MQLGVPARVEHSGAHLEARCGAFDGVDAMGQRLRGGMRLIGAAGGLFLENLDVDGGTGGVGLPR